MSRIKHGTTMNDQQALTDKKRDSAVALKYARMVCLNADDQPKFAGLPALFG